MSGSRLQTISISGDTKVRSRTLAFSRLGRTSVGSPVFMQRRFKSAMMSKSMVPRRVVLSLPHAGWFALKSPHQMMGPEQRARIFRIALGFQGVFGRT